MMRRISAHQKLFTSLLWRRQLQNKASSIIIAPSRPYLLPSTSRAANIPYSLNEYSCVVHRKWFSSHIEEDIKQCNPRTVEFPLPQPGEGIKECELIKWLVQEGDAIEEFQPLCEVQSDKAAIEITSPYKGKISHLRFVPGDMITIGETLLEIDLESNDMHHLASKEDSSGIEVNMEFDKKTLATPAVRHLAKEYGINIDEISGSGKGGRIVEEDVLKCANDIKCAAKAIPPTIQNNCSTESEVADSMHKQLYSQRFAEGWINDDKTISLRGFRRAMVKSMTMAVKVPHFHYVEEINVDSLTKLKKSLQIATADQGLKHSYLPFLIKTLSLALMEYPSMNSVFNEETYELICKGSHNIGVAMATEHGLVVPSIKNVQLLSLLEITKELQHLVKEASKNKLNLENISRGTITISNIGAIGGMSGTPLVNVPEVAVIALGKIRKLPRFNEHGEVYPASLMNVTISADHRVIDGATVALFCSRWKVLIENPEHVLLHLR